MNVWFFIMTMLTHTGACQAVNGERILGADLARALPAFSALPKDTIIGYSPAPGARRVFQFPELKRLGAKYGMAPAPDSEVCFEWQMRPLGEHEVRRAILEALHTPTARVEILASSKGPVPEGTLEFPLSGLSVSTAIDPATAVMWRGYVLYGNRRKYSVWARVRVSATMTRVIALQSLTPGEAVQAGQVRLKAYDNFPLRNDIARTLQEVVGRVPRRTIRAGLPVSLTDLADPFQVERGELVAVTAIAGAAQLGLDALAESSGRQGDVISLKNPQSGKIFRARIEGKGKAILIVRQNALSVRVQ